MAMAFCLRSTNDNRARTRFRERHPSPPNSPGGRSCLPTRTSKPIAVKSLEDERRRPESERPFVHEVV